MSAYAESAIDKELDIASFLKLQKKVRALIKALLTPEERLALRHNKRLVIANDESQVESSSDSDSLENFAKVAHSKRHSRFYALNPHFSKLIRDT
jgi:uncharacterized membrane protein